MFLLIALFLAMVSSEETTASAAGIKPSWGRQGNSTAYCLSWRTAVEANNVAPWATVPSICEIQVAAYMFGQYQSDLNLIRDEMYLYMKTLSGGNNTAWIFDIDDTCLSNLPYYQTQHYGVQPYDRGAFRIWALAAASPAICQIRAVFDKLVANGTTIFLLTGRDAQTYRNATATNLKKQGFNGYEDLIMREKGQAGWGAKRYKSEVRGLLIARGYTIKGNVGDQWTDLDGEFPAERNFKLPNPMYYVP